MFLSKKKEERRISKEYMKKLNLRKIKWILKELKKGELSVYQIAKQQKITSRWVRELPRKYADVPLYRLKILKCGRKPQPIPEKERIEVLDLYEQMPMCAVKIELYNKLNGNKHIPHNRLHKILMEAGKVNKIDKKIRRKKWVRYERKHSNSLWHTDYCEVEGMQIISFIDDASRFIVGSGKFVNATTDNALDVLHDAIKKYGKPKQIMTDHGSQFCTDEERTFQFSEKLKEIGIEHIMSRVKRPQSNGKIERWFGTAKRLYFHFERDLEKTVTCYNRMPHLSLDATPAQAYETKKQTF